MKTKVIDYVDTRTHQAKRSKHTKEELQKIKERYKNGVPEEEILNFVEDLLDGIVMLTT